MDKLIKQMREILGDHWSNQITVHILSDEIYFGIYENEVCIIVDLKCKKVYVECEGLVNKLNGDMLVELGKICLLLEKNLSVFKELLEWKEEEK